MFSHTSKPESVVSQVIDAAERVLWVGQPDFAAMISHRRRWLWLRLALAPIVLGFTAWFAARMAPAGVSDSARLDDLLQPRFLVPLTVLLLVIPAFALFTERRFQHWVRSLTYAITDRRLLIIEGERIVDDYAPEQIAQVVVVPRGRHHSDVIFGARRLEGGRRTRDPVMRERLRVGFKALPDAAAVEAMIESWLAQHLRAAEHETAGESDAARDVRVGGERGVDVNGQPAADDADDTDDADGGRRPLTHDGSRLRVDFPATWRIQVRFKKKPAGRVFLDREDWRPPEDGRSWNVARAEGPMRCAVEVEVFETAPTVTFESLSRSRAADGVAGPVVEAQPLVEINSLQGFSVTRRRDVQVDERGVATLAGLVIRERHVVLHDGRHQVYVRAVWPEESGALTDAVDAVVRSIRIP